VEDGNSPEILPDEAYAPINSNLQHPPRAYPGHLTVHRARGGGKFERCVGRVGNLNRINLVLTKYAREFFRFLKGSDGFAR